MAPEIKDVALYKKAMAIVYSQYKKPSAYRSGALVKKYKLHKDTTRQKSYLARAKGIKGDWKANKWSKNNLTINLLWA